ncbi:ABC transporter ATP-binding protein [Benzoatithermus flavus]|uniref:ABC transporter ATP-binding protein n=1 Tax=Benzoatithermus flavus TaxID=3108223 RepID=A0ABU8XT09_9PROT
MALEVHDLTAGYGSITVLRGISLRVKDGEIVGVLGRNGMGKSTLIRAISGLVPASAGIIHFAGEDITRAPPHVRARLGLTTVVQGRGIFPRLTVRENLEMGRIAGGGAKRSRLDEVLGYFPRLRERMTQLAGTMSGGEQQMLAIGRSLMTDPKLMLLDEPSDGIMPALVHQIAETLVAINRNEGMSIVIVEQNVPMVFRMTRHCVILEKGKVVAEGDREHLETSEVMRQYLAV